MSCLDCSNNLLKLIFLDIIAGTTQLRLRGVVVVLGCRSADKKKIKLFWTFCQDETPNQDILNNTERFRSFDEKIIRQLFAHFFDLSIPLVQGNNNYPWICQTFVYSKTTIYYTILDWTNYFSNNTSDWPQKLKIKVFIWWIAYNMLLSPQIQCNTV